MSKKMNEWIRVWHTTFGDAAPEVVVMAPGRVNIIGEHTDYNEGWVLPGAMSRHICVMMSRSHHAGHHWFAADLNETIHPTDEVIEYGHYSWARYILGAIHLYTPDIGPLHMLITGDLPVGAGISSSSALVCGVLYALQHLTQQTSSRKDIAILASRVEREVIGLQGGIMDQFAIMLCQPQRVMLLDCRTQETTHIEAGLPGYEWLLINTRVKHSLIDSDYNQRASECMRAVDIIKDTFPNVTHLRDVTKDMLRETSLPDPLYQRAKFVIEENQRVHDMVIALEEENAIAAGRLLQSSHAGLRDLYEVSCDELDYLADFANDFPGVAGARMMGGGFGGCVICLVQTNISHALTNQILSGYKRAFGIEGEVIRFELGGGVISITNTQ